jgi:NTE family protein
MGRTAIVLSGGGAKGAFQAGALDVLIREREVDPEVIVGVSTGTLNAVMLAQGEGRAGLLHQLAELKAVWYGIRGNDDVYYTRFGGVVGLLLAADSVYSNKPLWAKIRDNVDPARLAASGRVLRVGVVELMSGRFVTIDGGDVNILEMVRASASIPVLFNPVDRGADRYVDGGVRDITPLGAAFSALAELPPEDGAEDPADTIYVLLASPLAPRRLTSANEIDSGLEILRRSIDLLTNEVYRNDLELAVTINDAVGYHRRLRAAAEAAGFEVPGGFPFAHHRAANLVLVKPDVEHMGSLEFDPAKIRRAFRDGRAKAREALAAAAATGSNIAPGDLEGDE